MEKKDITKGPLFFYLFPLFQDAGLCVFHFLSVHMSASLCVLLGDHGEHVKSPQQFIKGSQNEMSWLSSSMVLLFYYLLIFCGDVNSLVVSGWKSFESPTSTLGYVTLF